MDEAHPLYLRWNRRLERFEVTRQKPNNGSNHWRRFNEDDYSPDDIAKIENRHSSPAHHSHVLVPDLGDY